MVQQGEQAALGGMPVRLWPVTPSKALAWTDCPREWRFRYLERRPGGPAWAHHVLGNAVHLSLREWLAGPVESRTPEAAAAGVRRAWKDDGFRDAAMSEQVRERAAGATAGYAAGLDPWLEPAGLERTVATRTAALAVSGRVDRIDRRPAPDGGEEIVVVDYKTGRRPSTDDDARSSLALAVYALAAERTLRAPCTLVELHHVPTGSVASWRHTPDTLARHLRRLESIAADAREAERRWKDDGLAEAAEREGRADGTGTVRDAGAAAEVDAVLPAMPSGRCGWCDHRRWCAEGQAAAAAQPPWAGVVDA